MRQQQAEDLLNKTFNQDFKIEKFSQFVKELFNEIDINVEDKTSYIGKQYKDHIADLKKLGDFRDADRKRIEVLAVKLERPTSLDRARTMQRNFIANWLGKIDAEGALVAFYDDEHPDWRFSFVKMEYSLVRDEGGKVKVAQRLTPARRYSYLVGVNEPNHTCRSQFLDLVKDDVSNPALSDLEQAFSIDNVTKKFFEKYKELVFDLKESIDKVVDQNESIKKEFDEKLIKPIDFAKKLLGQIVFLYFLQKKGWLGVEKGEKWGTGPHNFLRKLFGDKEKGINPLVSYDNFFNDILKLLFYDALAHERSGDDGYHHKFECKIPFLNGGLFEPLNDYDWIGTEILIENDVFEKIFKVFDRFNFTVKEDEPLDKEVAVDPEMLGKVFENLLELNERKDKGAFYTPREIVHYMCQQSLINYLETNIDIKREDIETFIQYGDLALEHVIKDLEQQKTYNGQSFVDEEFLIPESISYNFRKIDRLLKNIKIVDPAVGSGAFPVGMMNEIVKARSILTIYFSEEEQKERTNYNFKRETIANSLYGVDIDQSGVEIAKLRFWLSLIVDENDMNKIKPLPNLDHKVMCGNSLLAEFEGIKLFDDKLLGSVKKDKQDELKEIDEQILDLKDHLSQVKSIEIGKKRSIAKDIKKLKRKREKVAKQAASESTEQISLGITESEKKIKTLKALQKRYFNEQNRKIKRELRSKIDKLEWDLIEVTLKEQNHEEALEKLDQYKRTKVKPFFLWKLYFAEVFQRENPGFDIVIANPPYVSVKALSKEYKAELSKSLDTGKGRFNLFTLFLEKGYKLLRKDAVLTFIIPEGIYSNVEYRHIRKYLLERSKILFSVLFDYRLFEASVDTTILSIKNKPPKDTDFFNVYSNLMEFRTKLKQKELAAYPFYLYPVNLTKKIKDIIKRVLSKGEKLSKLLEIQQGIIYSGQSKEEVFSNEKKEECYKKVLDGRDVLKWKINWENKRENRYIKYTNKLHRPREERLFLADEKALLPRKSTKISCGYDSNKFYALNTAYILLPIDQDMKLKYILACINSKLVNYFYKSLFFGWQITIPALHSITIPRISLQKQQTFIDLVDQILSITQNDDYLENPEKQEEVKQLEEKIDLLVYDLYNLTPEEIKIVEDLANKKNKD